MQSQLQSEMFLSNSVDMMKNLHMICRAVVSGDAGGALAPLKFGSYVNPIPTRGGRLCPPNKTGTPGNSDLPTALLSTLAEVLCYVQMMDGLIHTKQV